jgi:hypothetical protein
MLIRHGAADLRLTRRAKRKDEEKNKKEVFHAL